MSRRSRRKDGRSRAKARGLPAWTPFVRADHFVEDPSVPAHLRAAMEAPTYINSRYQVALFIDDTPWGRVTHLSIKNRDRGARHDWRDLQRIKNELCGLEREAIEIYPAESRLVDCADQFHLWVLASGQTLPLGFHEGRVVSESVSPTSRGSQRPWEPDNRPQDLLSHEGLQAKLQAADQIVEKRGG